MQRKNHKMLAGLLAGAVLLAGGVGLYHVQATPAAAQTQTLQGREQRPQPDMDKVAAYMAKTFGVDEDEIRQALRDHSDFRDVGYAAMLARISGKPFQDVLAMKTESNHWRDVREQLGVTPKQEHEMHDAMMAEHISSNVGIDQGTAQALLANGYHSHDIEAAALLARESGKSVQNVLDRKKINNRWADVAKELGVDVQTLRQLRHGIAGPDGNFCNDSPCGASDDSYCRGPRPGGPCGGPDDCGGPRS